MPFMFFYFPKKAIPRPYSGNLVMVKFYFIKSMARPDNNKHDKYLCTLFPNRNEDETFDDNFDFCRWRIPDPDTYGEFFVCFIGQHEIGGNTGRDHIQLFVKTKSRTRYNQITARLGLREDQVHYKAVTRTPGKAWVSGVRARTASPPVLRTGLA